MSSTVNNNEEPKENGLNTSSEITDGSVKQTKKCLDEMCERATFCSSLVKGLTEKIKSEEISTGKGLDFLEVKNHLLLDYITNITGVVLTKAFGKTIQGSPFIDQLLETRVILEKMRPIEQKMKYQIDKLVRNAVEGTSDSSPLKHRAKPDDLTARDDDEEGESSKGESDSDEDMPNKDKSEIYRPPRVAPQYFDGDEEEPSQSKEKLKKRSINKSLIRELQEEFLDTPVEVHNMGDAYSKQLSRQAKDKQRFEETYMTRLPVTKKEKHRENSASTIGVLGDELTDFSGKRRSAGTGKSKGKKRKMSQKRGGSKKRMRK